MIAVDQLLYKFDLRLNDVATLRHQQIPLEDKLLYLNEAQIKLIKVKLNTNNNLGLGFDALKKRYEDVQIFVVPHALHPSQPLLVDKQLNKWVVSLTELKPTYMMYVDGYVIGDKENCKDRVITINHDLTKHHDVQTLLSNNHYKPSFEYQETFCTLSSNDLEVYSDGTFEITKVFLSYLRYPKKIDQVGYENFDGTPSNNQDCELPYYLEDELLNFATQEAALSTENTGAVQSSQIRIQTQE